MSSHGKLLSKASGLEPGSKPRMDITVFSKILLSGVPIFEGSKEMNLGNNTFIVNNGEQYNLIFKHSGTTII